MLNIKSFIMNTIRLIIYIVLFILVMYIQTELHKELFILFQTGQVNEYVFIFGNFTLSVITLYFVIVFLRVLISYIWF